jgi:Tfp pilus assembly protein PilO
MAEPGVAGAWFRRLNVAVTVTACATVVGIAYWYERAHRRWSDQNHPLAAPRARLERTRTNYRDRSALVTEMAQVANAMRETTGQYRRSIGS